MKILYILDQDVGPGTTAGILHKIKDKISVWSRYGVEVEILSLYSFKLFDKELNLISDRHSFKLSRHSKLLTLFRLMYSSLLLFRHIKEYDFDLIYMRARLYMPFIRLALSKYNVVMELNSDDVEEWKCNNKIIWIYNNITRNRFYSLASAFVSVSSELTRRYAPFNREIITIGNGVDTSEYSFIGKIKNKKPQVCFVGSPGFKWHGIDKIEYLAENCPDFDFHLIGESKDSHDNIRYYEYLALDEVKKIISKCDVSLSTMSLHVKNMDEASPLKSRQYLAQGIPLIYSYIDTDMDGTEKFALQIPNTPNNIEDNIQRIKDFILKCFENGEFRTEARAFAETVLDVKIKEEKRISFLKSFI